MTSIHIKYHPYRWLEYTTSPLQVEGGGGGGRRRERTVQIFNENIVRLNPVPVTIFYL